MTPIKGEVEPIRIKPALSEQLSEQERKDSWNELFKLASEFKKRADKFYGTLENLWEFEGGGIRMSFFEIEIVSKDQPRETFLFPIFRAMTEELKGMKVIITADGTIYPVKLTHGRLSALSLPDQNKSYPLIARLGLSSNWDFAKEVYLPFGHGYRETLGNGTVMVLRGDLEVKDSDKPDYLRKIIAELEYTLNSMEKLADGRPLPD